MADFYAARAGTNAGAPLDGFLTAVHTWFEQGKDDPKLALLRFDPHQAEIWENEWSLIAGIKLLFGSDPKRDYADKTANVRLD